MAKKNLSALMSGIMGTPDPQQEEVETSRSNNTPDPVESEKTKLPEKKRGRPRNVTKEERATFIINPELLRKIKYISLVDGLMQKEILDEALKNYISEWENRNGTIRIPRTKR